MSNEIVVYGAYGHTGRFVLAELQRRGWGPIAAGRNPDALGELAHRGLTTRRAAIDQPGELADLLADARAILNCAGPFAETAAPLIDAALRAGIPYLDIAGEPDVVAATFDRFGPAAEERGVVVLPAAGFFGALGDLLASAALDGWQRADAVAISYALDEWKPTIGSRLAMQRMVDGRLVFRDGNLTRLTTPPPIVEQVFPAPIGPRATIGDYPSPESVLIPQHLATRDVEVFTTVEAIRDLRDPASGGPIAIDDRGRSAQTFMVHAEVVRDGEIRNAWAEGRDIYATTAPILVECMERVLLAHDQHRGVLAAGDVFDARDLLLQLVPRDLQITLSPERTSAPRP
jgi:hypothetical protein